MMRSAVPLPPSSEATALVTINSGIVAVSAAEASAIERSNPVTFWKRLTTRSTNSGRSQNVSVRRTRSRLLVGSAPGMARVLSAGAAGRTPPGRAASRSGCRGALVRSQDEDAVEDVDAQGEDPERPPRVRAADRQQGADRTEAGADDADHPPVRVAGQQREAAGELDQPEDDQHPAHGVEVGEDE